jgi:pimeloyl-ACP methyl ester carboxylesterase
MGGGIAMIAALDSPDRVVSLTLIGASPGGSDLPAPSEEFRAYSGGENPDWSDREAVIDHVLDILRVFSAGSGHFDEETMRDPVGRDIDRTTNVASSQINHFVMEEGDPIRDRLGEINVPTLVIHGTEDPAFPLGHALALETEILGAELLTMEEIGHELPEAVWDVVVPAISQHTEVG